MKFRQKPPVYEAVQYDGSNGDKLKAMFDPEDDVVIGSDGDILLLQSKRACLIMVNKGDWLVKDNWGCVFSVAAEKFSQEYEKAE
mgnify:CR=1 FL=1